MITEILKNMYHVAIGRADVARWSDTSNLARGWDARTERMSKHVPGGCRVIELGAGRQTLRSLLPQDCVYIPTDIIEREPGTVTIDLNARSLPDLAQLKPELVFASGVLEYVHDLPQLLRWLARYFRLGIVSYACTSSRPGTLRRMVARIGRRRYGWFNTYNEEEIGMLFQAAGFQSEVLDEWGPGHKIFRFFRKA